jgi:aminopeptidase
MSHERHIELLADLLVKVGANVQEGQIVAVGSEVGKEPLTRAIAATAYRTGAKFVDVTYTDPHIKRARILNSKPDRLGDVPSWMGEKMLQLGEQRCARVGLSGPVEPHLLEDLDQSLVGRERSQPLVEAGKVLNDRTTNWTVGPCPTIGWAQLVHPQLEDADAALDRLWEQIVHVCRLDTVDPVGAWQERMEQLDRAARAMDARGFDALHFEGEGTDLTVGLLPSSSWLLAKFQTADGLTHMPNIPSEEIFTSPDPLRTDGVVRSTKPLVVGGTIVKDLEVEFRGGSAVRIDASSGADALRALTARDPGAARLGEVALVDGEGRIGPLDTVFYDTLLDENAASHIAFGNGFDFAVGDEHRSRVNQSEIHIDFMIGSPQMHVTGITASGERVPVLIEGEWKT